MRPLISVIVPVYNVERYLPQCLDSILAQTYDNLEIILINDGSTDSSGKICEEYADRDARIKTIHKPNEGLADARNKGVEAAAGAYFAFIDSDDRIEEDYIGYLYDLISVNHAQIAVCGYHKVYADDRIPDDNDDEETVEIYDSFQALSALLYQRGIIASAWGRLFQRELFAAIRFPKGRQHEDVAVMYKLFDQAQIIVVGSRRKYYYLQRSDSIVHAAFDERRLDYILYTQECIEYIRDKHPQLEKAAVSRHFSACFELLACIGRDKRSHMEAYGKLMQEIRRHRKTVLADPGARRINRIAAMGTYLSAAAMQKLCRVLRRP